MPQEMVLRDLSATRKVSVRDDLLLLACEARPVL
jgi:hypothetical protein